MERWSARLVLVVVLLLVVVVLRPRLRMDGGEMNGESK
jgi:hypothetical protein